MHYFLHRHHYTCSNRSRFTTISAKCTPPRTLLPSFLHLFSVPSFIYSTPKKVLQGLNNGSSIMNYGYGYIILDLDLELSARFLHSRTHSIRAGTHWMKKKRKGKKKKVGYIFFLALNTDLGQAHFIACMHIIFPRSRYCIFHLRPSLPTHPRPSWRLAKADVGGLGYFISLTTYDDFRLHIRHLTRLPIMFHLSITLFFTPYWYIVCMPLKLSKISLVGCIKVIYTGIYISFVCRMGGHAFHWDAAAF
jgi:hypothetical protein